MRSFLVLIVVLSGLKMCKAATNEAPSVRTQFAEGAALSAAELEAIIQLANRCGIWRVTEVTTERHLGGTTIQVAGDEEFEGRSVRFKMLRVYPKDSGRVRPGDAPSVGAFWARESKPGKQERTLVRIGNREFRVGLLDGIKPAGADKILDAFVKGRVHFKDEFLKNAFSQIDVMQPGWIGVSSNQLWITFARRPLTKFIFRVDADQVTLVDTAVTYE